MGLYQCGDCGSPVSDRAPACPKCGAPSPAAAAASGAAAAPAIRPARRATHPVAWLALVAIIGYLLYAAYQANLPRLPVDVKFRPALVGPGLVLLFENTSGQQLTFVATMNRQATSNTRSLELYAGPHQTVSVGSREGWVGEHGDQITVKNNHFQSWSGSIP
jgi:hypothetical protein